MALISIKEGNKTRYMTKEAYERYLEAKKDRKTSIGDVTCSGAKSVGMGFTQEQYDRIFKKSKHPLDKRK